MASAQALPGSVICQKIKYTKSRSRKIVFIFISFLVKLENKIKFQLFADIFRIEADVLLINF